MVIRTLKYFLMITAVTSPAFSGKFRDLFNAFDKKYAKKEDPNADWSAESELWRKFARNISFTAYNYNAGNADKASPMYNGRDFDRVLSETPNFRWTHETFKEILKKHNVALDATQSARRQLEDFRSIVALRDAVYKEDQKTCNKNINSEAKQAISAEFLRREYPTYLGGVVYYDKKMCDLVKNGPQVEEEKPPFRPVEPVALVEEEVVIAREQRPAKNRRHIKKIHLKKKHR